MKALQDIIDSIVRERDDLLKEIESLEKREGYSRQSLDTLQDLNYAGYGLKELNQLKNTVFEIAVSNGIGFYDAGRKFLKDVENQYDNKLGFETKIKEIKTELKKLEDEVPGYKEHLQSQVNAFGVLQYLYKFGITDDDIINMSDVVTAYKNGNINFEITRQRSYLDAIRKEIDDLNSQRQKLNEQALLSAQLLNSLNGRLPHFIETLRQIMFSVKELNKMFIVYQPLFLYRLPQAVIQKMIIIQIKTIKVYKNCL